MFEPLMWMVVGALAYRVTFEAAAAVRHRYFLDVLLLYTDFIKYCISRERSLPSEVQKKLSIMRHDSALIKKPTEE